MAEGKLIPPVGFGYPLGKGPFMDFFGLNYYSRDMLSGTWNPAELFGKMEFKAGAPTNDLGWELYPEGLSRIIAESISIDIAYLYISPKTGPAIKRMPSEQGTSMTTCSR